MSKSTCIDMNSTSMLDVYKFIMASLLSCGITFPIDIIQILTPIEFIFHILKSSLNQILKSYLLPNRFACLLIETNDFFWWTNPLIHQSGPSVLIVLQFVGHVFIWKLFIQGKGHPLQECILLQDIWKVAHVASDKMKKTYPCPLEKHFHLV